MRPLVERYVRSLKERDDAPERQNDLGTLVCWILGCHGYTVLERPFKHEILERRVSKGRRQFGIDILAVKEDEDGALSAYRLVLKRGAVRSWTPGEDGSMAADLWYAASEPDRERRYGLQPSSVTVIAVHNGDRDSEAIGTVIEGSLEKLRKQTGARTEWWDAAKLTDLIMSAPSGTPGDALFPPVVQPFVRMALDSLLPERGRDGAAYDLSAADLLVQKRLGSASGIRQGDVEEIHRRLAEMSLFVSMVQSECDRVAAGNTLPLLDTLERVACASIDLVRRECSESCPAQLKDDLRLLVSMYADAAERLRSRLEPVLTVADGLGFPSSGEPIQYPLRALRLSGYLAAGGHAALAVGDNDRANALGASLASLWKNNPGGCLHPVTDDQLIEILLVWELWAALGMATEIRETARELIERFAFRRAVRLPLPALWQRARVPMRPEDLGLLVEAWLRPRASRPSAFTDEGSSILPTAVYVAHRLAAELDREVFGAFRGNEQEPPLCTQVWVPPDDAGDRWYCEDLEHDGTAEAVDPGQEPAGWADRFETVARALAPSVADRLGVPVFDRIAWKHTRTPPPPSIVVALLKAARPGRKYPCR